MAQSLVTDVGTLFIPGAYATYKVQPANSGLSANGILMLMGEADAGPAWSGETDLSENAFGPDQLADVVAKYKAGPIVDAFQVACAPMTDPQIQGSFSRAIIVKTNISTKASGLLGTYGTLYDRSYGDLGNMIFYGNAITTAEVVPEIADFTFVGPAAATTVKVIQNGVLNNVSVTKGMTPAAFQAAIDALTGVDCTGGAKRDTPLTVAGTLQLTATGNNISLVRSINWATWGTAASPAVGDTLTISATSVLCIDNDGAGPDVVTPHNEGAYVITGVTATTITAIKVSDGTHVGAVANVVSAPTTKIAVSAASVDDIEVWEPVSIAITASSPVAGAGKTLEIAENSLVDGSTTDSITSCCFNLGTATKVSWISTATTPYLNVSSAERIETLSVSRSMDAVSEELTAGGEIAMKVSFYNASATAATLTITSTKLTTTITGVVGSNLDLTLANFPTIGDLVQFINTTTGYSARVGTSVLGQMSPSTLDRVSAIGICAGKDKPTSTTYGSLNGRIKIDAYRYFNAVGESVLVQLGNPAARADAGLPGTVTTTHLTGGAKGPTLAANMTSIFSALELVRGNFLVPLFSRDASFDKTDGLTDSSSDYTISAIHAAASRHVTQMSTLKRRKNRQAILAIEDTFTNQKEAAANVGSFRANMLFQNDKVLDNTGVISQKAPWMAAVHAAASQAAAFYRPIFNKTLATSGFVQSEADFNDQNDTQVEDALKAGLMPARRAPDGSWRFVSDQTTYGRDSNFVYNSLQAVYIADIAAMTTAERMENAFVGQSVADISAAVALSYLETILGDLKRLKIISASDDAPYGYKNATITISGGSMIVSVEIKLAGAIMFIPISFLITPVQQTANQ